MGIIKEIWTQDIKETLHQENEFISQGTDHGIYTGNGVVHVPQSGAAPAVVKNRGSVPATIAQRTDTDLTYLLNEFTTDPILIKDFDEMQTSYAKRASVLTICVKADILNLIKGKIMDSIGGDIVIEPMSE